jgi:hypothetical protein
MHSMHGGYMHAFNDGVVPFILLVHQGFRDIIYSIMITV